jgi:uncharacterized protein YqjF (DUF2071 family)
VTADPSDAERLRGRAPPTGRPTLRQIWRHLGFLHWPVDGAAIARLLPPGLEVDTFAGVAYVGIVPFTIPLSRTAALGLPVAPAFHEVNLRTYVHRAGRDPGVWFFSLDAASRLAVAGARVRYALPYFHARMAMAVTGDAATPEIAYASRRRGRGGDVAAELRCRYRPTGPVAVAAPGSLEFFLAERYLLYAWNGRALRTARVHHLPYPLQPAAADDVAETLAEAAGLPPTSGPPTLAHYARQVEVRIYPPIAASDPPLLDKGTRVR